MRAIITGSNSGLGLHTATELAKQGYEVVLAVRSAERGALAAEQIRSRIPAASIDIRNLDLSSLASVQAFAESQASKPWNILINNAGAKIERPYKTTDDGFEWHQGVNHLGHFALTAGLWPARASGAKIVTVSSIVARGATLEQASSLPATFNEGRAYADSKLLNLLFAMNLARLIQESGVEASSMCAHPGFARAEPYGTALTRVAELALAQTAQQGSRCTIDALNRFNGSYVGPRIFELWGAPTILQKPLLAENSEALAYHWGEAERLTGIKFRV